MSKKMLVLLGLVCIFVAGPSYTALASTLPAIGDAKSEVELQYGPMYVVQEDNVHFWTDRQWAEQHKTPMKAKAYGYLFSVHGITATLWVEYSKKDRVEKETLILDGNLKVRHFGQYFPELHTAITAKDSTTAVIRNYPRDQLAVKVNANVHSERWVRFFFIDDDKSCINMHSKIKGFEIAEIAPGTSERLMTTSKTIGCRFNGNVDEFPADGTWNRTDNYFMPQLYFSEHLIPRRGTDIVVIHHAAMPTDTSRADIHELHLSNGWAGIGYHKLVFADGALENGRPEEVVGAHAAGANRRSFGIVLVGDFSKVRPSRVQLESAARLTLELMEKYRIPLEKVRPHRAVTEGTDCPGLQFPWQEFIQMLTAGVK